MNIASFFEPKITMYWRGRYRKQSAAWWPSTTQDEELLRQLLNEAHIKYGLKPHLLPKDYETILAIAGQHDLSIETIGAPEDES